MYLEKNQVTNGHVSMEAGHIVEDSNLPNLNSISISSDPWLRSEILEDKMMEVYISH